ncbi:MAG: DUF3365 domain-containing protein [Gammaproteobacteria bacterium]|nr:DUF3365 domain-containing protein [Gammaproteobacteria bacterium]
MELDMIARDTLYKIQGIRLLCISTKCCLLASLLAISSQIHSSEEEDLEIALALADVLRAARSEIAHQQPLINEPSDDAKNLDGERVVELVQSRLASSGKADLLDLADGSRQDNLIQAQLDAIREVINENQPVINRSGVGFKGFVPAVFTRLVNERFGEKAGRAAKVKVTAPMELVRNRKSRPDIWERGVIEQRFQSESWNEGELYAELTELAGVPAYRVMVPEYYGEACLSCHGDPKGSMDITGYPKEGGKQGDLGGSISIALFK